MVALAVVRPGADQGLEADLVQELHSEYRPLLILAFYFHLRDDDITLLLEDQLRSLQ